MIIKHGAGSRREVHVAVGLGAGARRTLPANTLWNFTVFGADIAFFTLGLNISSAYTVLPLFVHHLTPDNVAVALIPALRALGTYGPTLFVAPLVERLRHALPYILVATILERVPFLLLALATLWLAHGHPRALLALMLVLLFLALGGGGLTYPAWLDLIARSVPGRWLGRFFGFWSGLGGVFGVAGAAVAAWLIAHVDWPLNFALCFLLTFGAYCVSYVLLALGREPARTVRARAAERGDADADGKQPARTGMGDYVRREVGELVAVVRGDAGLRRLLVANAVLGVSTMASALFAVAALKQGGLSDAEVGIESTVLLVASTAGNFLWGMLGDRLGHRAVLVLGAVGAALSAGLALVAHGFAMYSVVFFLLGLNVSAVGLAALTFITDFGPAIRRPTYVALASVGYAPFAIGAPLLAGVVADAWGYTPVFVVTVAAGVAAALLFQFWVPDPRKRERTHEVAAEPEPAIR